MIYPVQIVFEGKSYFAGYSTVTDRYFTPAFPDPKDLLEFKDLSGETIFFANDLKNIENNVSLTKAELQQALRTSEKMASGGTDFTEEEAGSTRKVTDFLLHALGMYDQSVVPLGELVGIWAKEADITSNGEEVLDFLWSALGCIGAIKMDKKEAIMAGRCLQQMMTFAGFTDTATADPVGLLNRLYRK